MTQKKDDESRVRKAYSARGTRAQKMFNFRCDLENWEWLQQQPNKGRFLNEIIRENREKNGGR